jgi:hypothetical protein
MAIFISSREAATSPALNSSESPGNQKPTNIPVSIKTKTQTKRYKAKGAKGEN